MIKQSEIGYGGLYRLTIAGELVGELVPGNAWSEIYKETQARHENVEYSWVPFEKPADTMELPSKVVTGLLDAVAELENHIPTDITGIGDSRFIVCSCNELVKSSYWTRHAVGGSGSAHDTSALDSVSAHYLV